MGSKKRLIKLQQRVLQAAELGSLEILRTLLHSHSRPSRKEQRKKARKQKREEDHESRRQNKRSRKAERREARESSRRDNDRKRRKVREESDSDEDSDGREEEETRGSKRVKREDEDRTDEDGGIGPQKPGAEGGQADNDESSLSNDRASSRQQSSNESESESDIEEMKSKRARRKHNSSAETVRSILNCRDAGGMSPLHHASRAGFEDLVKYLISKGASVHARNSKGDTPLHIVARHGPVSLLDILTDAGADMEAFNDQGETPSDILGQKEAASLRAEIFKDQTKWYSHLAEELSDNEDNWYGMEWGDSERPDWEDPRMERFADSRQGRGLYEEPFSLRDFLKAEKNKTQSQQETKTKRKERQSDRPQKDNKRKSPEVIGPMLKVSVKARSYSQRWKTFSESYNLCLSYASVPFPVEEGKEDTLQEVLLEGINPSLHRAELRKEMLKWHPDKFLQKWGVKLQGPDHDRIVARVNGVSEAIHQLYKNLAPVK